MNRHLRNFAFFLFGFLGVTGYVKAGWYVDDGYSHSGGNLNRSAHGNSAAGSSATATVNGSTVEVNRSWTQAMGDAATGAAAQAAVNVLSKIPKAGVVNAAKGAMSVSPAGLAGSILAQWLLQQSWEWANEQWTMPANPTYPYMYKTSSWWACGTANQPYSTAVQCFITAVQNSGRTTSGSVYFVQEGAFTYIKINAQPTTYGYIKDVWSSNGQLAAKVAATAADIASQADAVTSAQTADVLRELAQRNIELQDATNKIQQLADSLSAKVAVESSTQANPDGTTTTQLKEQQQKYEIPTDEFSADAPVPVKQSTVTTTTTNVYNTDNSVKTTTNTTTANNNPAGAAPKEEQKTDCDKNPNSVGCSDWGDAPDAPDIGQQEINPTFSWSPFSLPSVCPQPQQLGLSFGTVALTWQPECDFATKIRPLVLAFAGLTALYIAFGMKQDG
ncbi:MAG: hypothetical protein HYZ18_10355 [Pseudogulbenkiania sp.]|nr:hypothetical protein [Pseudogulbenkiania sp.]